MCGELLSFEVQGRLLKELLGLKFCAIAVGLGKEPCKLQRFEGKMEFCRMWAEAQKGKAFFVTAENFSCFPGGISFGLT